jgi:DNA modification methylase
MAKIKLICGDAKVQRISCDLIVTDPPFDMPGDQLAEIIKKQDCAHLLLIATMRQILEFVPLMNWKFGFDFVLDAITPKKSKSIHQPNYTHHSGIYLHKDGERSLFNRKRRQRSDVFEGNGYWPTIFYAPKERVQQHSLAKNADAITDLIGSFDVSSVADLFAGSGTVGMSAFELNLDCTLVEHDKENCKNIANYFKFMGANFNKEGF